MAYRDGKKIGTRRVDEAGMERTASSGVHLPTGKRRTDSIYGTGKTGA